MGPMKNVLETAGQKKNQKILVPNRFPTIKNVKENLRSEKGSKGGENTKMTR